jgi:moderate conductance mechanosensitive channel
VPAELQALFDDLRRSWGVDTLIQLVIIAVATFIALRFVRFVTNTALDRLFMREATEGTAQDLAAAEVARRRTQLEWLTYRILRVIVWIIAFLMVLGVLDIDIGPAIAGLGILGLAVSLGTQSLIKDYIGGAFILIENQYATGDMITVAGVTGTVEDISLRRTALRDTDGTVHTVPHGLIEVTSNLTRNWANINFDVPIAYDVDVAAVSAVINDVGAAFAEDPEWKPYVLEAPKVLRVDQLRESSMTLKVLGKVQANRKNEMAGELRQRVLAELARRNLVVGWRPSPGAAVASAQSNEERQQ